VNSADDIFSVSRHVLFPVVVEILAVMAWRYQPGGLYHAVVGEQVLVPVIIYGHRATLAAADIHALFRR